MQYKLKNLAEETVSVLKVDGYEPSDISFITLYDEGINIGEFFAYAKRTLYYAGYGHAEIPPFVIMMADNSWYERREYDGKEWWHHVTAPCRPTEWVHIEELATWQYPEFFADTLCEDELAQFYEEYMDALCDEIEDALWRPDELITGKWDWSRGRCATKSRCKRLVYSERPFTKGGGGWAKHQSRCWKDQRGKGKHKRYHQYH